MPYFGEVLASLRRHILRQWQQRALAAEAREKALREACRDLLAGAWDGDPLRQAEDPACVKARAALSTAVEQAAMPESGPVPPAGRE
jgi:hypothetical protein